MGDFNLCELDGGNEILLLVPQGLRYKLRKMGIPVDNTAFIHGNNQSVLWNTTVPKSTLKKKSSSVAYHYIREDCAKDMWRTAYV